MGFFKDFNPLKKVGEMIDSNDMLSAAKSAVSSAVKNNTSRPAAPASSAAPEAPKPGVLDAPAPPPVPGAFASLSVLVAVDGKQYGPYERATLIDMIGAGTLTRDTYVFIQGMSAWQPASAVPEVAALFGEAGVPAPPQPFAPAAPAAPGANATPGVMSAKLAVLVDAAVADGEISDLERQVLIRNAQAEGISMDEFVVVLEGKLFAQRKKLEAEAKAAARAAAPSVAPRPAAAPKKPNQYGDLRKCPNCNSVIEKMDATVCPQCGYQLKAQKDGNSITLLIKELDGINNELMALPILKRKLKEGGYAKTMSKSIKAFEVGDDYDLISEFLIKGVSQCKDCKNSTVQKAWSDKLHDVIKLANAKHGNNKGMEKLISSTEWDLRKLEIDD